MADYGNSKGPILAEKSRMRCNVLLTNGADPREKLFVKHHNYHVRRRAYLLSLRAGYVELPTDDKELTDKLAELHIKREVVAQYLPAVEAATEVSAEASE